MLAKALTKQKLQLALSDNKSYAGTQPFFEALESGDTKLLIQKINPVFIQILSSDKVALMSKLLVLRMYKDIFLIGNIDLFDEIDPAVQQAIISAAAYNPKFRSKGKSDKQTRGGMYFVQLQKRPKNTQSLQLGNSFVLFSTQIIRFFAAWLPQYPKNEESRFMEAYHELQALGVQFNTNIYLQIEEKKKFQKNFQEWNKIKREKKNQKQNVSNEQQMVSSQVGGEEKKQLDQKNDSKIFFLEQNVKDKNQQVLGIKKELQNLKKAIEQEKVQKKKLQSVIEQKDGQIIILKEQKQNLKIQIQCKNNVADNNNYFEQLAKIKKQMKQLMEEKSKLTIIKNNLTEKFTSQQTVNMELSTRCSFLEGQLLRKNEQNQMLRQENETKLQNQEKLIIQLKNKAEEEVKTTQQIQNMLQKKEQQLYSKNIQADELLVKIRELQNKIFQTTESGQKKSLSEIKCEKKEENQIEKIKSINYNEIQRDQNQNTSKFTNTKKQQRECANKLSVNSVTSENPNYNKNENSNFYQINKDQKNSLSQLMHKSKNSIHKTQCSKFRQQFSNVHVDPNFKQQKSLPFSQVDFNGSYNMQPIPQNNYFKIKQKDIIHEDKIIKQYKNKNIAASVYPLIQEYFYPLRMSETQHFRAACISEQARQLPFYSDQLIQLRICESQLKQIYRYKLFQLCLKNVYHQPISVRLTSQNQQIKIKNQNSQIWICSSGVSIVYVQASVTNLNFRFPIFNVFILTKNSELEKGKIQFSTELPIPITLFNLSEMTENPKDIIKFDKYKENCYKKHKSEKISINSVIKNLPSAFPLLTFRQLKNKNLQTQTILSYPLIPEIKIKLIIIQEQKFCQFSTEFLINSKNSQAFSKVILQALMFICG